MKSRKPIAIVDDDADDRFLVQEAFTKAGYQDEFIHFENGPQFMEFLHNTPAQVDLPSLLFLDLNMPVIEGKEILREIKRNDRWAQIPVIVFTTANSDIEKRMCFQLGASSYITKPAPLAEMERLVKAICVVFSIPTEIVSMHNQENVKEEHLFH